MGRQVIYRAYNNWGDNLPPEFYANLDDALAALAAASKPVIHLSEIVYQVWQLGRPDSTLVATFDTEEEAYTYVRNQMVASPVAHGPYKVFFRGTHSYAVQRHERIIPCCFLDLKERYTA